jgi:hypothetical protein
MEAPDRASRCCSAGSRGIGLYHRRSGCRSTAAKNGAWHQDELPTSKLPGSPRSFSAWLCSPSSCCPLCECKRLNSKKSASTTSANVSTLMPIPTSTATDPCAHDTGGDLSPLSTSVHWNRLAISATPPRAPGARRVLRLEPRVRRPAAVWRIRPLRDNALQPHAADVLEHGRAVTRQMFNELDGAPLGPADLSPPPG